MVSQWYVMIRSHPVSLFLKDFRTSNIMIKLFNCCFVNGIKQYILIELGQNIGGHILLTLFEWQSNIFTLVLATTLTFQKWQIFIATWDFLLDSAKNRRMADVNAVGESTYLNPQRVSFWSMWKFYCRIRNKYWIWILPTVRAPS